MRQKIVQWHKVLFSSALLLGAVFLLVLGIWMLAGAEDGALSAGRRHMLAFNGGKSSGSPYGDILKSIQKGKEQKKQEMKPMEGEKKPEKPKPLPQKQPEIQQPTTTPLPEAFGEVNRKTIAMFKGKAWAVDGGLEVIETCRHINKLTDEILQEIFRMYSIKNDISITEDTGWIPLYYCKETRAHIRESGHKIHPDGDSEQKYQLESSLNVVYCATYVLNLGLRKGKFCGFRIFSAGNSPQKMAKVQFFSGWVLKGRKIKLPVIKYEFSESNSTNDFSLLELSTKDVKTDKVGLIDRIDSYHARITTPGILFSCADPTRGSNSNCTFQGQTIPSNKLMDMVQNGRVTVNLSPHSCIEGNLEINIEVPPLGCKTNKNSGPGAVAVAGDCIDHGGFILPSETRVFVNDKPVARDKDTVFCLIHGITEIAADKSVNVHSSGIRLARVGDKTKCGAKIIGGSRDTFTKSK